MIELKLNGQPLQIPSSWKDVTYKRYCDIIGNLNKPFIDRLHIYTGIPIDTLNKLTAETIGYLSGIVCFMETPDIVETLAKPYIGNHNIASDTYGRMEACKAKIKAAGDNPISAGAYIVKKYTEIKGPEYTLPGKDITNDCILDCYNEVAFFLHSLQHLLKDSNA